MPVEENRRIALHRAAADSWGEEVADTLVELVAPSGHELATREDVEGILAALTAMDQRAEEQHAAMERRWSEQHAAMEQRWSEQHAAMEQRWSEQLAAMDRRWDERLDALHVRLDEMDARWQAEGRQLRAELLGALDRRIADAITSQTRTLTISVLTAVVAMAGIAFGLR